MHNQEYLFNLAFLSLGKMPGICFISGWGGQMVARLWAFASTWQFHLFIFLLTVHSAHTWHYENGGKYPWLVMQEISF